MKNICPTAIESRTSGRNSGKMGGRECWAMTGTFCHGRVQGEFASKMADCAEYEFYIIVVHEEGLHFQGAKKILDRLK